MKSHKNITLIVTVYNLENKIDMLLDSIKKQSDKNYKLLFIDDGSKDKGIEKIKMYLNNDSTDYRIIHQENKGVCYARNLGIDYSDTDYIIFIDGDDFIAEDYIESFNKEIEDYKDLDFIFCGFDYINESRQILRKYEDKYEYITNIKDGNYIINRYLKYKVHLAVGSFCIRKDVLINNNLRFNIAYKYGEDMEFQFRVLAKVNRVKNINRSMLYYVQYNYNSKKYTNNIRFIDGIRAFYKLKKYFIENDVGEENVDLLEKKQMPLMVLRVVDILIKRDSYELFNKLIVSKVIKNILFKNIFSLKLGIKTKVKIFLILLNKNLYFRIRKLSNE